MSEAPALLGDLVVRLREAYGPPDPVLPSSAFEFILWEKIAYLASDERRTKAFLELRETVGTTPAQILNAPIERLREICAKGGIHADVRAARLQECARIVNSEFDGDLEAVLHRPLREARKAFLRFPYIGEPGADKILVFSGAAPLLALESNGLRVLLRMGYGEQRKSYSSTYRSVQEHVKPQLGSDCARLVQAHLLLRTHGQERCKESAPLCRACVLRDICRFSGRH